MANKVRFGLEQVHVWPITAETSTETTYGPVIKIPGAVTLNLKAEGDENPFYADNILYFNEFSNDGYSGDLEMAIFPDDFLEKILGYVKDTNGALVESADSKSANFALAFEFKGDAKKIRHLFYKVNAGRPSIEGETISKNRTPKTESVPIKAMPDLVTKQIKVKLEEGATGYDTFFGATPYKVVVGG